jgi:double-stranded uracil-DNA glycosylase
MSNLAGFAPIVSKNAKMLILGTMPGSASLLKQQYYGHPRNAFWPIMNTLFAMPPELCYRERKETLIDNGIALWDVLQACKRRGSLDSNIEMTSIKINNFEEFFAEYYKIKRVFFNGAMAEKLYRKYNLPLLLNRFPCIEYHRLPSTSPAYASLSVIQKAEAWKIITQVNTK